MSNVLAPFCRIIGALPLTFDPPATVALHGLNLNNTGQVYAAMEGTKAYVDQGLPFTALGQLCVTRDPLDHTDQGLQFDALGRLRCNDGNRGYYSAGVPRNSGGAVYFLERSSGIEDIYRSPLEAEPQWAVADGGANPTQTRYFPVLDGIGFTTSTSPDSIVYHVPTGQQTDGRITATLLFGGTSTTTGSFFFAMRATNSGQDFVGVRSYSNELQLFERVGGAFTNMFQVANPAPGTEIAMELNGANADIYVGGVLAGGATTTILTAGWTGLIARGWTGSGAAIISNWQFT